jgi:hypothetical protein
MSIMRNEIRLPAIETERLGELIAQLQYQGVKFVAELKSDEWIIIVG